jgi:hypothetical protein
MSIVDSVRDTRGTLEREFKKAQSQGQIAPNVKFRPVARVIDGESNLYEMFCLSEKGRRMRSVKGEEFRPVVTGSVDFVRVYYSRNKKRYVPVAH